MKLNENTKIGIIVSIYVGVTMLFLLLTTTLKGQEFILTDDFPAPATDIYYDNMDNQYVTLKNGTLYKNGQVFQTFQTNVANEQGLLAVCIWNDKLCVHITTPDSRYQKVTCDGIDYITVDYFEEGYSPPASNRHRGGDLVVMNNNLYASFGMGYRVERSQDDFDYRGKIIKLSTIYEGIVIKGLRNPFRFDVDPLENFFIADVGGNHREEITIINANETDIANLGWPCWEGTYEHTDSCGQTTLPQFEYDHSVGASIIGGVLYGEYYYFADYITGFGGKLSYNGTLMEEITFPEDVVSMDVHNDSLMVLTLVGQVYSLFIGEPTLGVEIYDKPPKRKPIPRFAEHFYNYSGQHILIPRHGEIYYSTLKKKLIYAAPF